MFKYVALVVSIVALVGCGGGSFTASGVDPNGNPISVDTQWTGKDAKDKEIAKDPKEGK